MNTPSRKQFMELVACFNLATEATKEQLASEYDQRTQQDAAAQRPITPMLLFCMERAGTPARAEAIFNHVLKTSRISYWPMRNSRRTCAPIRKSKQSASSISSSDQSQRILARALQL